LDAQRIRDGQESPLGKARGHSVAQLKFSNAENVAAFFGHLKGCTPNNSDTSAWLADLERHALNKRTGWKDEAEAYVRGLVAAGALSADAAASCRGRLAQCIGSEPAKHEWILPMAWTAVVAVAAVSGRTLFENTLTLAVVGLLTAAVGCWWTSTRPWTQRRNNPRQRRWARPVFSVFIAVALPGLTYLASGLVGDVMQAVSIKQFTADRDAFIADPNGFPMLRRLAREQYGVEVVLGDAVESWASTTVNLPNASPASMLLQPGYCHLSMHRPNVLRTFKPVGHADAALLVQGVMLHEFAHCLDVVRDTPTLGQRDVGTHSIAPVDASGVNDIEGWIEARSRPSTQLWREAVADIMTVGYWRLVAPDNARALVASLRQKRSDATHDTTHATMCWIDVAARAAAPSSLAGLFAWADQLRIQAPCELSQRRELTRVQKWARALGGDS
jgi:hypothetical protein